MTIGDEKVVAWLIEYMERFVGYATNDSVGLVRLGSEESLVPVVRQSAYAELAAELAEVRRERDAFAKYNELLTHKVITCGVAASHPNPILSKTGAYAAKWDSPQAQDVRALRDRCDAAESQLAELEKHSERIEVAYLASESRAEDAESQVTVLSAQLAELRGKLEGLADKWDSVEACDVDGTERYVVLAKQQAANELRALAAADGG